MEDILLIVLLLVIYFAPAFISAMRGHRNAVAVFILNLFLGWTLLGWIVALVWSFTSNTTKDVKYVVVQQSEDRNTTDSPVTGN